MKVEVLDGPRVVAVHERTAGKYAEVLILDHYLDVLKYKPGALPGATALAQARAAGAFTASHQRYWDAARRTRGDGAGTRALTEVLLGHRTLPASALTEAMDRAVSSGAPDPQAVLIDARRPAGRPQPLLRGMAVHPRTARGRRRPRPPPRQRRHPLSSRRRRVDRRRRAGRLARGLWRRQVASAHRPGAGRLRARPPGPLRNYRPAG